ncbi:MAG: glyoxalase [Gordonia sp.]|nr:glyoxalase [Gordonia sp. (in: high G+C Gram-positive bacteria)]
MDGLHHLALTVGDIERSVDWYARVLGFDLLTQISDNGLTKAVMRRSDDLVITLVAHGTSAISGDFDERRSGLDHISFAVAHRDVVDNWVQVLHANNVPHSQPVDSRAGYVVSFRDPDNIALEFYASPPKL